MPRLIQDLLEHFSGRYWPRSPREIVFLRNSVKFQKIILPNWVHRRPFRQSLAGILGSFELLAFHRNRSDRYHGIMYWDAQPVFVYIPIISRRSHPLRVGAVV